MDPLKIFSREIAEVIFSNLSPQDLLTASLVNSEWYTFIAENQSCMQKLIVKINNSNIENFDQEHVEIFEKSMRRYEELRISYVSLLSYEFLHDFQWKKIELKRITISEREFHEFLHHMDSSIEDLRIDMLGFEDDDQYEASPYSFKNLKRLELKYIPNSLYDLFKNCRNIRTLYILSRAEDNLSGILNILYSNIYLNKLSIVTNSINKYFIEDISLHIHFKLKYFEIRDIYNLTPMFLLNFKKFLEKQIDNLETLDLGDWISIEIVKMIFHMSKLTTLTFKGFYNIEHHLDFETIEFHKSQSITSINLIDTFSNVDILKIFLQACPRVTTIKLYSLKDNGLEIICKVVPKLKKLSIDLLEIKNLSSECDLKELKEFKMKTYNKKLKIFESSKNNLEKLIAMEIEKLKLESSKKPFVI